MPLSCGCDFMPGQPIPAGFLANHYEHTFAAMMLWELIMVRPDHPRYQAWQEVRIRVSEARIAYLEALKMLFPIELKEE